MQHLQFWFDVPLMQEHWLAATEMRLKVVVGFKGLQLQVMFLPKPHWQLARVWLDAQDLLER